jgi:hypothetical protein
MRLADNVTGMGKDRGAYGLSVGKYEGGCFENLGIGGTIIPTSAFK